MANEIGTGGIELYWAVESSAGTKPSTFTSKVTNIKEIPAIGDSVSTYDATDLSDTEYKRNIPGLKDLGNDIALSANITSSLIDSWASMAASAKTAYASGKKTWFKISIPGFTKSFTFSGIPVAGNFPGASTDNIFEGDLHIVPNGCDGWA